MNRAVTDRRTDRLGNKGKHGTHVASSNAETNKLGTWVIKNSGWLAIAIIIVGFAVRLICCAFGYLNPDEAEHFNAARANNWLGAYESSHMLAHPPLLILVLHGILLFGRSELILRIPSLTAGTLALWLTFAWIRRSLGQIPALAGLVFLALSPAAIAASIEVRQYGLLLCFVCGALYATERTFTERSTACAVVQGLCLLGAVLTHYTAPVVVASLGLYVLLRYLSGGIPLRILSVFGACQLVLATVLVWLYVSHVRGNPLFGHASLSYLDHGFMGARETLPGFVWRSLFGTFSYLVSHRLAPLAVLVFLAGLATLLSSRTKARLLLFLMLISPFVVGFVAAICRVLPFAGDRHQTYLLPFVAAGFSAVLTSMRRSLAATFLLLGVLLASVGATLTTREYKSRILPIGDMAAAIAYMEGNIPRDAWLFVDDQTRYLLGYYLARNDSSLYLLPEPMAFPVVEELRGYRVVTPRKWVWSFIPNETIAQMSEATRVLGVPPSDSLWIVSAGWRGGALASQLPAGSYHYAKEFGKISVINLGRASKGPHAGFACPGPRRSSLGSPWRSYHPITTTIPMPVPVAATTTLFAGNRTF